jgi:predicted MFS family arabinose efflux permease
MAAVLLLTSSPTWAFGLNAVSYLAPIAAMLIIRFPERPTAQPESGAQRPRGSIMEGLRYIARDSTMLLMLLAVVLTNGAVEALRTLAPSLADERGLPEAAGFIVMGYSTGALLGLFLFGVADRYLRPRLLLVSAFALQALGLILVVLAPTLAWAVAGALPIGLGFALSIPRLSAGLQMSASDGYRSRVMAAFTMAHLGLRPFFALLAGALASLSINGSLLMFVALAVAAAIFVARRDIVGRPRDEPE